MLRKDTGRLAQNLVRSELLSEPGVMTVSFESSRNRLSIEYDSAVVDDSRLMLIIRRYGVCAEPPPPRRGAALGNG
ncbi:MAG: hypothetical protein EHM50_00655 [Lysobacterales bacterium]|nr:MAG: hypothetical protein EHM50_00655 [Xanthomonadales bacterium]